MMERYNKLLKFDVLQKFLASVFETPEYFQNQILPNSSTIFDSNVFYYAFVKCCLIVKGLSQFVGSKWYEQETQIRRKLPLQKFEPLRLEER